MSDIKYLARVRLGALLLMIPVIIELLRYSYDSFFRAWRFSFGEPERWQNHWMAEEGAVIDTAIRLPYFAFWVFVIFLSMLAYIAALYVLNRVRMGLVFDRSTARGVWWLGAAISVAMIVDQVFQSMDAFLITRMNAEPAPIRWFYDPSDLKTLALGVIILLFGWIIGKGIDVAEENRGFV